MSAPLRGAVSQSPDRAAIAVRVDRLDAHGIAGANAHAQFPVRWNEGSQHLHETPVDLDGDETAAVAVEVRHGPGFVLDGALQGDGGRRLEPEHEVPERV